MTRLLIATAAPLLAALLAGAPLVAAEPSSDSRASSSAAEAEPCHEGHCHGSPQCNGVWKDYRERLQQVGPAAGAASGEDACKQVIDELVADAESRAAARCNELHPCGSCPDKCSGCASERPWGRIEHKDKSAKKTPSQRGDGSWECAVDVERVFRCRCGHCKPAVSR